MSQVAPIIESARDSQELLITTESFGQPPKLPLLVLPSYEDATDTCDMSRLPPYRQSRVATKRYHPYLRRRGPALTNGSGMKRLLVRILPTSISLRR